MSFHAACIRNVVKLNMLYTARIVIRLMKLTETSIQKIRGENLG